MKTSTKRTTKSKSIAFQNNDNDNTNTNTNTNDNKCCTATGRRISPLLSPNPTIEEIENAFTLRQFHKAIKFANIILLQSKSDANNVYSDVNSNVNSTNDSTSTTTDAITSFNIPMNLPFNYPIKTSTSSSTSSLHYFKVMVPPTTAAKTSVATRTHTYAHITVQDRAAIIAIQSSYELWKQRRIKSKSQQCQNSFNDAKSKRKSKVKSKTMHMNMNTNINTMDEELIIHLQPFLQLYSYTTCTTDTNTSTNTSTNTNTSTSTNTRTISFDLLLPFMKFIYAIGLHMTCVEMILYMMDTIFIPMSMSMSTDIGIDVNNDFNKKDNDHDDNVDTNSNDYNDYNNDNGNEKNIYNQYCYEYLHLLLIDILPNIKNQHGLDYIMNELIHIILMTTNRSYGTKSNNNDNDCSNSNSNTNNNSNHHPNSKARRKGKGKDIDIDMKKQQLLLSSTKQPLLSSVLKVRQGMESIINFDDHDYDHDYDYTNEEKEGKDAVIGNTSIATVGTTVGTTIGNTSMTNAITIPIFIKECIEDCIEDLYLLEEELLFIEQQKNQHQEQQQREKESTTANDNATSTTTTTSTATTIKSNLSSIVDSLSNRLMNQKEQDNDNVNDTHTELTSSSSSSSTTMKDLIIDPLWNSEERWMNRGKVITVGLVSYSILWKKRRKVMNITKSVGQRVGGVLISPLREIVSALKS